MRLSALSLAGLGLLVGTFTSVCMLATLEAVADSGNSWINQASSGRIKWLAHTKSQAVFRGASGNLGQSVGSTTIGCLGGSSACSRMHVQMARKVSSSSPRSADGKVKAQQQCMFSVSKTPINQTVQLGCGQQPMTARPVATKISIQGGSCQGVILHERYDKGMHVGSELPEGCQFLTDDRTEYRCIWDHRFAAGEEVILQVTPTVTVAEVGRALQLSAVTSVSGHQQAVAEGDHNNNMTAYSFITTRPSTGTISSNCGHTVSLTKATVQQI